MVPPLNIPCFTVVGLESGSIQTHVYACTNDDRSFFSVVKHPERGIRDGWEHGSKAWLRRQIEMGCGWQSTLFKIMSWIKWELCYLSVLLFFVFVSIRNIVDTVNKFFLFFFLGFGKIVPVEGAGRIDDQYHWTEFAKRGRKRGERN